MKVLSLLVGNETESLEMKEIFDISTSCDSDCNTDNDHACDCYGCDTCDANKE
ncbi:MAG: hypothetical protein Athens071416_450 [Parcubacteria group bacterium Athens0714_16]|nr:MAG: hypothetical protein Athens071416_450 [Parcubacteria group bacterium Athens0714_16]